MSWYSSLLTVSILAIYKRSRLRLLCTKTYARPIWASILMVWSFYGLSPQTFISVRRLLGTNYIACNREGFTSSTASWCVRYVLTCLLPLLFLQLYNWTQWQRKVFRKHGRKGFDSHRLAKLEAIDFDFDPGESQALHSKKKAAIRAATFPKWNEHFQNLVRFKKEHEHLIVGPRLNKEWSGLHNWIHSQRRAWSTGKLEDELVAKLTNLGFDFAPMSGDRSGFSKMLGKRQVDKNEDAWHRHYVDLQRFKKANGHCYVHPGADKQLFNWIHVQRKYKRRRDKGEGGPASDERVRLLDAVGLDWNPALTGGNINNERWDASFESLRAYQRKRGHANPPKKQGRLGGWASKMRTQYAKKQRGEASTLTDDRIARLEGIGFKFPSP